MKAMALLAQCGYKKNHLEWGELISATCDDFPGTTIIVEDDGNVVIERGNNFVNLTPLEVQAIYTLLKEIDCL